MSAIVGTLFPRFIVRPKSYGIGIVFLIVSLVTEAAGPPASAWQISEYSKAITDASIITVDRLWIVIALSGIAQFAKLCAVVCFLLSYWPNGKLFSITPRDTPVQ
jgi:hypothetical protein